MPAASPGHAMGTDAGRSSRRFQRLKANLRRQRRPCCICHQPIDYSRRWPDPKSFTVEHLKPMSTHPHLAEDPANLDAAHYSCNSSRGNRRPPPPLGQTSRNW